MMSGAGIATTFGASPSSCDARYRRRFWMLIFIRAFEAFETPPWWAFRARACG